MKDNFQNIIQLEKEFKGLLPMKAEDQRRLDEKMRLEFNYNTNHIEGNTLSYIETKALLLKDLLPTTNKTLQEVEEIKGHDVAFEMIKTWAKEPKHKICEKDIKELNKLLLVKPYYKDALTPDGQKGRRQIQVGQYKEHPNSVLIDNGEKFEYASPLETPIKMAELIKWLRQEEAKDEPQLPIILASELHYRFVRIHPFDDGNGRISRLLVNYILLKNNLPPIVIKSADKKAYLNALRLADAGNHLAFYEYMAEQLAWSLQKAIDAAQGKEIEDEDDIDKEIEILKKKISGNSQVEIIKKSDEVIYDLYLNGFAELFAEFEKGLSQFYELFVDIDKATFKNRENRAEEDYDFIANMMSEWATAKNSDNKIQGGWQDFNAQIYLKGLKSNNLNTSNISANLLIHFKEYKYRVRYGNPVLHLDKAYSEKLSKHEITQIVRQCKKDVLEQIKTIAGE